MEHIIRNAILALLEQPSAILPDILRLLTDKTFRKEVIGNLSNPQVRRFWTHEFEQFAKQYRNEGIAPIQNKVGAFLADPALHRIFTRTDGGIRLRSVMDAGKILLVNLSHGSIGEDSASLLGALLVTSIGHAAFSRANQLETDRRPFFLYVDEFQTFTTLAVADMLSGLRKFSVGMVLAHQYLHQLEPDVLHAVMGNAGTLISFRLGAHDANLIAREFEPRFGRIDLINLPNHHVYVKLLVDGEPIKPFSATTLLP